MFFLNNTLLKINFMLNDDVYFHQTYNYFKIFLVCLYTSF